MVQGADGQRKARNLNLKSWSDAVPVAATGIVHVAVFEEPSQDKSPPSQIPIGLYDEDEMCQPGSNCERRHKFASFH